MKQSTLFLFTALVVLAWVAPAMAQRTKGTVTNSVSTKTNSTVTLTSPK